VIALAQLELVEHSEVHSIASCDDTVPVHVEPEQDENVIVVPLPGRVSCAGGVENVKLDTVTDDNAFVVCSGVPLVVLKLLGDETMG
jgi:hypothetical protein